MLLFFIKNLEFPPEVAGILVDVTKDERDLFNVSEVVGKLDLAEVTDSWDFEGLILLVWWKSGGL